MAYRVISWRGSLCQMFGHTLQIWKDGSYCQLHEKKTRVWILQSSSQKSWMNYTHLNYRLPVASKVSQSDDPSLLIRWRQTWFLLLPCPRHSLLQLSEGHQISFSRRVSPSRLIGMLSLNALTWKFVTSMVLFEVNPGSTALVAWKFLLPDGNNDTIWKYHLGQVIQFWRRVFINPGLLH